MNKNAATVKPARLSVREIATEKAYRRDERLGHLAGTSEPTDSQRNHADLEADLWESRLLLSRILDGTETAH